MEHESTSSTPMGGWLTAVLILLLPVLIGLGGWWLLILLPDAVGLTDPHWQALLRWAGWNSVALLLAGGFVWWVGRARAQALWRGVGLSLLVAAVHSAVGGGLLALDKWLTWPGLPHATPALFSLGLAAVVVWWQWPAYSGRPAWGLVWWGLALGWLLTWVYLYFGSVGTAVEFFLAAVDALGTAAILTVLLTLPLQAEPDVPQRHPWGTFFLLVWAVLAFAPSVLATRGFLSQGFNLTFVLWFGAGIPASLVQLAPGKAVRHAWPAILASLWGILLLPLALVEGAESDVMVGDLTGALLFAVFVVGALTAVFLLAQWPLRRPLRRLATQPWPTAAVAVVLALFMVVSYRLSGGAGFQPEAFMVVLRDQANTDFARTLPSRDERVTAVYTTLTQHARTTQADLHAYLDGRGLSYTPFYLVNALEVQGSWFLRWQLLGRDDVERVLFSPQTRPTRDFFAQNGFSSIFESEPAEKDGLPWGIRAIRADQVWARWDVTGAGIIVGSADSGVDWHHPDLQASYAGADGQHDYHWFDPALGTLEPTDTNGHGSHTTGTAAGQNGIGVAPGATWIACRNLPRNLGNPADYLACMEFLFAPFPLAGDSFTADPLRGAHVTNNSWGCPPVEGCDGYVLGVGAHHLYNAGQMMVVSNGNSGPACDTTGEPANNDEVLSVGAMDESRTVTDFSSRGPATDYDGDVLLKPDLVAPGDNVLSAWLDDGYVAIPGTSMAGPHVAGAVALLWSADSALIGDVEGTTQLLRRTTADVSVLISPCGGEDEGNNATGVGLLDVYAAVEAVLGK